ncbi:MAG: M50 family metallopeptidase [Arthrobacter sp.]|jgi:hypothetical protein|nr:M50 family metallopeptidase [Arthrobacter sp.]
MNALQELPAGLLPGPAPTLSWWVPLAVAAALLALLLPGLWLRLRLLVTLSHELGHAGVGVLGGRRFKGFVVNRDMSGHAVTSGKPRGPALVLSTWSGYPAPALLGALLVNASLGGWAGTVLGLTAVILVLALLFSRSWGTAGLVLVAAAASLAAAWFLPAWGAATLVLGVGVFLLLGAWRHLGVVMRSGGRGDDPSALARATGLPAWFWLGTFILALAACTAWAGWPLWNAAAAWIARA